MKASYFTALALAAASGLAACGTDQAVPAASTPDEGAELAVNNVRLVLPAVKGNPGALYFDLANSGSQDAMVMSVAVKGAKSAAMHSMAEQAGTMVMSQMYQQPIKAGQTVKFEPGGMHVMAFDLDDTLKPGGTTEVTFKLLRGETKTVPAAIKAPGDAR